MSGVSSISGSGSDAYYYQLQIQIASQSSDQSVGAITDQSGSLTTDATSGVDSTGLDSSQLNDLEKQIKKAIEEALYAFLTSNSTATSDSSATSDTSDTTDSAGSSSSTTNSKDLMTVIKNAVDEALKDNGIDPQQLAPPPPPPPPPSDAISGAGASSTDASTSTDTSSSTSSSDSTNASSATNDQNNQIIKLLQELLAALQSGQNGSDSVSGYLFDQVT
jgi:hypothetical protein